MKNNNKLMTILTALINGQILPLPDGNKIGMAEDYTIGFIIKNSKGVEGVGTLCELTLRELNELIIQYDIIYIPR